MVSVKATAGREAERGRALRSIPPRNAVCLLSSQGGIWQGRGFKLLRGQSDRKPGGGSGGGKHILYGN